MEPTGGLEPAPELPPGIVYRRGFVTEDEERALLERIAGLELRSPVMHGTAALRQTAHFGWQYGLESRELQAGPPIPDWLLAQRPRVAELAGLPEEQLEEVLVTRYPPGAGIGWHRDAPAFGSRVVGISLLGACRMRFRNGGPGGEIRDVTLEPRSAYLLSGAGRWRWQHGITAVPTLRYSITWRTLKRPKS